MNIQRIVAGAVLVAIVAAGLTAAVILAGNPGTEAAVQDITGSWQVDVTPDPGSGVPPFVNFSVATRDGLIVNSNDTGHASVGVFTRTGNGQYALMFTGFDVVEGQSLLAKVRSQVSMGAGGESFSGPFTTELYDPQGNLLFSIEGTVEGTRLLWTDDYVSRVTCHGSRAECGVRGEVSRDTSARTPHPARSACYVILA